MPASALLEVCEVDEERYGHHSAAGEGVAYLAGLLEGAAIEQLAAREDKRLWPPPTVPASRLREIFID